MLIRPLIQRELLRECRRRSHFVLRTLFVLALMLLILWSGKAAMQMQTLRVNFGRSVIRGPTGMRIPGPVSRGPALPAPQVTTARVGIALFSAWATIQYVVLVALSTIRSAGLADERRRGSLPLLRSSGIGDAGLVYGWFLSTMGRALLSMILTLPVLVISLSLGGFTLVQVFAASLVTLVAAAWAAALTLVIASRVGSTGTAVTCSIILQAAALLLCASFVRRLELSETLYEIARDGPWLHGFNIIARVVSDPQALTAPGSQSLLVHFVSYIATRLILVMSLLPLARCCLSAPVLNPALPIKRKLKSMDRFFLRLSGEKSVLWHSGLGSCKWNPVLWRERAVSILGQRDHMIRIAYVSILAICLLTGFTTLFAGWGISLGFMAAGMVGVPALLFVATMIAMPATTLPRERQRGTVELLAVSPLSARSMVWGKYLFCLRGLLMPLALLGIFALAVIRVSRKGELLEGLEDAYPAVCLIILAPLIVIMILYVSAGARNLAQTLFAAMVLVAGLLMLLMRGLAGDTVTAYLVLDELRVLGMRYQGNLDFLILAGPIAGALAAWRLASRFSAAVIAAILILGEILFLFWIWRLTTMSFGILRTTYRFSCIAGVAFSLLGAILTRKQRGPRMYLAAALVLLLVLTVLRSFLPTPVPLFLFFAVTGLAFYRLASKMPSTVIGRTMLCLGGFYLAILGLGWVWGMAFPPPGTVWNPWQQEHINLSNTSLFVASVGLLMTITCLRCTILQFDRIIGRNG